MPHYISDGMTVRRIKVVGSDKENLDAEKQAKVTKVPETTVTQDATPTPPPTPRKRRGPYTRKPRRNKDA